MSSLCAITALCSRGGMRCFRIAASRKALQWNGADRLERFHNSRDLILILQGGIFSRKMTLVRNRLGIQHLWNRRSAQPEAMHSETGTEFQRAVCQESREPIHQMRCVAFQCIPFRRARSDRLFNCWRSRRRGSGHVWALGIATASFTSNETTKVAAARTPQDQVSVCQRLWTWKGTY